MVTAEQPDESRVGSSLRTIAEGPCSCPCHDNSKVIHFMPCCALTYLPQAVAESQAAEVRASIGTDKTDVPAKYILGQRVKVSHFGSSDFGKVESIRRMFHNRLSEWVWGYRVDFESSGAAGAFEYVPEGYLKPA